MAVLMSVGEGMAINDLPSRGIPLDKIEEALRAMLVGMLRPTNKRTWPKRPDPDSNLTLSFPVISMSAKSSPLVRAATALLAATMLAGTPVASFAASEAAPVVKQVPPSIRVVAAEKRELVETLSVNGSIVAREEAAVGTDLNGLTVIALNADEGDLVKKGDVLAVLDRSMLDTQLAQIEASRAQAEANIAQMRAQIGDTEVGVRQAKEALERADALQKKGVATEAQRDNAVNALDSAKAKLDSAEKALKASEAQLGVVEAQRQNVLVQIAKTELRAPADGLILARNATLGGVVMAQTAPLFRIAINGEFELAATVAETALPQAGERHDG